LGSRHVFLSHVEGFQTLSFDIEGYYERYGPMVLRRCRALLHNDAQAQDAMQDVFVALLRHRERLTNEAPAALLLRVATNTCLNRLRAQRSRPEDADDERLLRIASTAEGDGRSVARDLLAKLFQVADPLAASSQTIAVMHLVDGMTLEEVAREAGMSVSGVRKRLRSVRARLVELEGVAP
jgi:RNA polymerase sigma-70 factor (ECF subfamily)